MGLSRIRLWDKSGTLIREPNAPAFREFVLNDIGNARFVIKAAGMEPYVQFGNYITIEHETLETYVGVIQTPRNWTSKSIEVTAKSAMWLFSQRRGAVEQVVEGSWSSVLAQVIGIVNGPEQTLLQIGNFNDSGVTYGSVVDMTNPYTYLQRALAQAQTRLDFRPVISHGKLAIMIDIQPTLYTDSNLRLYEGYNLKKNAPILIEQGDIYNDVTILGIGLDQTKYTANLTDPISIQRYGLRQVLFSEGTSQADVNRLAVTRLAQYAYPRRTFAFSALDVGNTFSLTKLGAIAQAEGRSVGYLTGGIGYKTPAYITCIQFDDRTKEAALVCKEV